MEATEMRQLAKLLTITGFLALATLSLQAAGARPVLAQGEAVYLPLLLNGALPAPVPHGVALETIVAPGGLERPVDIANAGDDRLFVVSRSGTIGIVKDGSVLPQPFLDIGDRVEWESHGERGLLGLVFHPDYANNGYLYVNYTAKPDGATHIARFEVGDDPDVADPNSEVVILAVPQPAGNHNAGDLAFGPDGYLYVPLGDGGGSNDPGNRAQNPGELLGKIVRLDVDERPGSRPADCGDSAGYRVPPDNPLIGEPGACDEIWALGLRNPWRFSFDYQTNEIFIADVGQSAWEEINAGPASAAAENYGWSCYEGTHLNPNTFMSECEPAGAYTMPVFEYENDAETCSVTGGFVYRGQQYPALAGRYLFTDFCAGYIWELSRDGAGEWTATRHDYPQRRNGLTTFGEGVDGELYVANMITGTLYQVVQTSEDAAP
jgi:glucose/arabinose dehydrogenase